MISPLYLDSDIREIATRLASETRPLAGATVLLTGGHGFLGRYLVALCGYLNAHVLRAPCRLIVIDNHITSGKVRAGRPRGAWYRFIKHDVIRPLTVGEPVDFIIHAAGIASPQYYRKYPLETLEVSTAGTKNMLLLGRGHRLKGFLFFSSSEIYGDPDPRCVPTPESYRGNVSCLGPRACYDESKRVGETLCRIFYELHRVPARIVRPFNVYGPGMQPTDYRVLPNFAGRIIAGDPLHIYGSGKQTRTFCYITDAIVGFMKVLLRGRSGEAYNIGNPVPEISMLDLARMLEQVLDRRLDIRLVKHPAAYPADEPQRRCPDIAKAATGLDFQPIVRLEDGLQRFMDWAQHTYAAPKRKRSIISRAG